MHKTDGEYELVLGNRQLLSAFFIIVILFGVFFTLGYVVGRNSAPAAAAALPPVTTATTQRPEAASPATVPPAPSPSLPSLQEPKASKESPPVETIPVVPRKSEAPPRKREAPPERPIPPSPASEPPTRASGAVAVNPGPGNMYLQVAAAAQPQAGVVVDTLKQKGFPALLAIGPNPTLFRVMVGPYPDAAALGKAKADLENAGFHPLVRK